MPRPQCNLSFKEWLQLQEVGTGTSAVAVFARPIMGTVTRSAPKLLVADDKPQKKKKKWNV